MVFTCYRFVGGISSIEDCQELGVADKLANRLLCFVMSGLTRPYRIPVAYFFTCQLNAEALQKFALHVITQVEQIGFKVTRLVTDNLSV